MLDLSDIHHLPDLAAAIEEVVADGPGLVLIAGLDPPPAGASEEGLPLPSGRPSVFRMLARRLLASCTRRVLIITSGREIIRVRGHDRKRVETAVAPDPVLAEARLRSVLAMPPALVIVERLEGPGMAAAALDLASRGAKVLAQFGTPARGLGVMRELLAEGVGEDKLTALGWIVATQRAPSLCLSCAGQRELTALEAAELRSRFPEPLPLPAVTHMAHGCLRCNHTGRSGEVALFDVYRPPLRRALITYEHYALQLARDGLLAVDDVLALEAVQLRQVHALSHANEAALREANALLQRKVAELESAHRVSSQRTEALVSLQRMAEVLLSDATPEVLARHICQQARELCGADRVILYAVMDGQAHALGQAGWGAERLPGPQPLDAILSAEGEGAAAEPVRYSGWPPGIERRTPDIEGAELRAGLRMPLVAQGAPVGALYVHSTVRTSFAPGHVALLQTFAAQAALALQRAALTAELRAKIAALEAAQVELAVKARMARELELARQVQQSFLPHTFPEAPGYVFAAYNEPAFEVGGDFYDVIELGQGRVGLVVADVSDKGMAAALYMALSRSLIRAEATRETSPRTVLGNVNRLLLELGEQGMFLSAFYAVLDASHGSLTYARAGHDYPLLIRNGESQTLQGKGTLLGLFEDVDATISEEQVALLPGDRLLLYTDGLCDVANEQGEQLGMERLTALLGERSVLPAAEMARAVAAALQSYRGQAPQADDMTLLVVEAAGGFTPTSPPVAVASPPPPARRVGEGAGG